MYFNYTCIAFFITLYNTKIIYAMYNRIWENNFIYKIHFIAGYCEDTGDLSFHADKTAIHR